MPFFRVCDLFTSSEKPDVEEAKRIIENEYFYNASDGSENTLLHYASKAGNHEIVQFLVDSGSKVNACNNLKQTPLVSTLETCNPSKEVIEILIKAGANIIELNNFRNSAVSIVNSSEWLSEDTKRFEIYKMLLEKADYFEFFDLLKNGNEKIIKMLLQTNIDLSVTDSGGSTLVHVLAQNSNPGVMATLCGKNFDINARTRVGFTPLMDAVLVGATSAIEFLLDEGADVNVADDEKKTALYFAYEEFSDEKGKNCIQVLLESGANAQIEVDDDWCPTIFDLMESQSFSAGELLLAHLSLQEAKEANITQVIYSKINSDSRFQTYFKKCKKQLVTKIYRSVTLLHILTASERKLERYLRDKELASKLVVLQTADYFNTILRKRLSKATSMVKLRETAASILCGLMEMHYDSYPSIIDKIINYLEEKDLKCLISI